MVTLFENTNLNARGNKKFTLVVKQVNDTHYEASQKTFRVFDDGEEKMEYEKTDVYTSLDALLTGEFTRSRQGKLFLATFAAQPGRN